MATEIEQDRIMDRALGNRLVDFLVAVYDSRHLSPMQHREAGILLNRLRAAPIAPTQEVAAAMATGVEVPVSMSALSELREVMRAAKDMNLDWSPYSLTQANAADAMRTAVKIHQFATNGVITTDDRKDAAEDDAAAQRFVAERAQQRESQHIAAYLDGFNDRARRLPPKEREDFTDDILYGVYTRAYQGEIF